MAVRRFRLSWHSKNVREDDQRPRLRLPLIPALLITLALANVASAVLALAQ